MITVFKNADEINRYWYAVYAKVSCKTYKATPQSVKITH
jgi:hypothetical protein